MSDAGLPPERPIESPAEPTDEIEIDAADDADEAPTGPAAIDWEAPEADVVDQRREVPLDDDR